MPTDTISLANGIIMADGKLSPLLDVLQKIEVDDKTFQQLMLAAMATQNDKLDMIHQEIKESIGELKKSVADHEHEEYVQKIDGHAHPNNITRGEHEALDNKYENMAEKNRALEKRLDAWQNKAIGIGIGVALVSAGGGGAVAVAIMKVLGA